MILCAADIDELMAEDELARRYGIEIPRDRDLPISWNIAPTQDILAIRYNPESKQRCRSDDNFAGQAYYPP